MVFFVAFLSIKKKSPFLSSTSNILIRPFLSKGAYDYRKTARGVLRLQSVWTRCGMSEVSFILLWLEKKSLQTPYVVIRND